MGLTHFDEARRSELAVGHLHATWSYLGEDAGCVGIGLRRIQVREGAWSTPAHEHGRSEEIFYVLAGQGLSWQRGEVAEIGAGDCIVYLAGSGAHTLHALTELPAEPGARPRTIVNVVEVEGKTVERQHVGRRRRNLGVAAGSVATGLQHVEVIPGKESAPLHCHSLEDELFVMLEGDGVLVLDDREELPVRPGSVVSRPAGTGVSHLFRAGDGGLTYLAYGTRDPGDICYYPRSNKINFGGIGVIGRIEKLDYWDGED